MQIFNEQNSRKKFWEGTASHICTPKILITPKLKVLVKCLPDPNSHEELTLLLSGLEKNLCFGDLFIFLKILIYKDQAQTYDS